MKEIPKRARVRKPTESAANGAMLPCPIFPFPWEHLLALDSVRFQASAPFKHSL